MLNLTWTHWEGKREGAAEKFFFSLFFFAHKVNCRQSGRAATTLELGLLYDAGWRSSA
jgi:hypothetical protein